MTKEELIALGLNDEEAQKVLDGYKGYVPKARFDEVNEAKKNAEALVKERDGQIEALKTANADNENLKKQIADLQESNKKAVEEKDAEIKKIRLDNAVQSALTAAGAKNSKAVLPFLKLENAEFDDDGNIKGLGEQIEALKTAEDSSFLFNTADPSKPKVSGATPKAGDPKSKAGKVTKEEFEKMGYKQRLEIYNTDKELYDALTAKDE